MHTKPHALAHWVVAIPAAAAATSHVKHKLIRWFLIFAKFACAKVLDSVLMCSPNEMYDFFFQLDIGVSNEIRCGHRDSS